MNKRFVQWLGGLLLCGLAATGFTQQLFQEGVHYQRLAQAVPAGTGERPEVVEMFSYRCPHCFHFEPTVQRWLQNKPEGVDFIRVPVSFGRADWEIMARAYYTAEELGVLDRMDQALFDAIHVQGKDLMTPDALAEVFAAQGVDKASFESAFNSFAVETKLRRAKDLVRRYQISGVPTLVVDGQYKITGSMAGSNPRMFDVVDFLLRREGATG